MELPDIALISQYLADLSRGAIGGSGALIPALFVVGLIGGATHCVGMCGPFVLAQAAAPDPPGEPAHPQQFTEFARLRRGALLPYHAGRATTYTTLGGILGAGVAGLASGTGLGWLPPLMLGLAAALFLASAVTRIAGIKPGKWLHAGSFGLLPARWIARLATPLLAGPAAGQRYLLGVVLGFLPCGMLYAALAAAGSAGSGPVGAAAMLAFALGTMPALVGVGYAGQFARRWHGAAQTFSTVLMLFNAVMLGALAWNATG